MVDACAALGSVFLDSYSWLGLALRAWLGAYCVYGLVYEIVVSGVLIVLRCWRLLIFVVWFWVV